MARTVPTPESCEDGDVKVSNPDKPIFEEARFTKADLVAHYELVGPKMLEFVADRPLTLQRFPNGISKKGFMQKNASDHFPDSIRRFEVPKQDGGVTKYPLVDQAEDIAYLANQGTVTFHMWTSTADRPHHPDWMVMDLDPDEGDIEGVRLAVRVTREVLTEFGLDGFPMVTGSSGFHVWVPLDGEQDGDQVATASRALAGIAERRHPDELTTEFLKKDRKGRVFLDWLRNGPTATVVAPYSLRPRPTAPVAVPITWDEVGSVEPGSWTLGALEDRLDVDTDLPGQSIPVDAVIERARSEGVDLDSTFDRFGRR